MGASGPQTRATRANTSRIAVILKRGIVRRCRSKSGTEESVELMTSCNLAGLGTQHRLQRPAEGTGEAGNALVAIVDQRE